MKNLLLVLLTLVLLSACSESEDPKPNAVFIRVENSSLSDFTDVTVRSGGSPVGFGAVDAGSFSDYKEFEIAYRYGMIELKADGEELRIIPFDYVGETPLANGYYTYNLSVQNNAAGNPYLSLELEID
jgi:hypothetical protein